MIPCTPSPKKKLGPKNPIGKSFSNNPSGVLLKMCLGLKVILDPLKKVASPKALIILGQSSLGK